MDLRELLEKSSKQPKIYVYTQSSHGTKVTAVLNKAAESFPDYRKTLYVLAMYPVQRWAYDCRTSLQNEGYDFHMYIPFQKQSLYITEQLIFILDDIISGNEKKVTKKLGKKLRIIQAIHGLNYPDVSKYLIATHYEETLLQLCEIIYKRIERALAKLKQTASRMDDDIRFVCHDGNQLKLLKRQIKEEDGNRPEIYELIKKGVEKLDSYPIEKDLKMSTEMFLDGKSDMKIAEKADRSTIYIRSRYNKGMDAVAWILWGYSSPELI